MDEKTKKELFAKLCDLSGETVARLFTDYHGMQLLNEGFAGFFTEETGIDLDYYESYGEEE